MATSSIGAFACPTASGVVPGAPNNPTGFITYIGATIYETTAAAGAFTQVILREGSVSGKIIDVLYAAAGQSSYPHWDGPEGIKVAGQIYCVVTNSAAPVGAVGGAIYFK